MGFWSSVNPAPFDVALAKLMTDGRLIVFGAGFNASSGNRNNMAILTPDSTGSYANGTWSVIASTLTGRLYFGAHVMPDNQVFVSGGEYSSDSPAFTDTAEVYFPWLNQWVSLGHLGIVSEGDAPTLTLADGSVLIIDLNNTTNRRWSESGGVVPAASNPVGGLDEGFTVLMQNDLVLAGGFIGHGTSAARYYPNSDSWNMTAPMVYDAVAPSNGETGPACCLYDGRVVSFGGNGLNQIYNPNIDVWTGVASSPVLPNGYQSGGNDNPAAVLPDGRVLIGLAAMAGSTGLGDPSFPGGTYFYIYDPNADTFTQITSPTPAYETHLPAVGYSSFVFTMTVLPNGQVLLLDQSTGAYVYTTDGVPNSAWKPQVWGLSHVSGNIYQLTGAQLCGLTEGAYYGDDWSTQTNMPVSYLKDQDGVVYWCQTSDTITRSIAPDLPSTALIHMPTVPSTGTYDFYVVANGIASDPWSLGGPPIPPKTQSLGMIPF